MPGLPLLQSSSPHLGLTSSPQICQTFPGTHLKTCFVLSIPVAPTYLRPHCRVNSTDLNSMIQIHCSKLPAVLSYKFTWFIYFRNLYFFYYCSELHLQYILQMPSSCRWLIASDCWANSSDSACVKSCRKCLLFP